MDFHTPHRDQFSTFCSAHNIQIGYAPAEFLLDEQPLTFKARGHSVCVGQVSTRCSSLMALIWLRVALRSVCFIMICHDHCARHDLDAASAFINGTYLLVGYLSQWFCCYWCRDCHVGSLVMTVFWGRGLLYFGAYYHYLEYKYFHVKKKWRIFTNLFTFSFLWWRIFLLPLRLCSKGWSGFLLKRRTKNEPRLQL